MKKTRIELENTPLEQLAPEEADRLLNSTE